MRLPPPRVVALLVVGVSAFSCVSGTAFGQAAGSKAAATAHSALDRGRTAWEKGDYDVAEPLYAEAVDDGGLAPNEVLEAYVHLGSARAVLGKKREALAAFKAAALIDPAFSLPADAGKKAAVLASQAKHAAAHAGPVSLHVEVPDHVAPRTSVGVDITLDPAHASVRGGTLGVTATNSANGASHVDSVPAATTAHFDLPPSLSLPSATLQVRVDWRDGHANRLASVEEQVHVQPLSMNDPTLHSAGGATGGAAGADAGSAPETGSHGHGFWHTAWPYILGGAALAAGGAAIYFATRTGGDVNVTGVRVVTH